MIKQMTTAESGPMAGRSRWRAQDARECLEAWRRSGDSIEEFARTRGLSPQRLYRWRARLGMEMPAVRAPPTAATARPAFVPVTVRAEPTSAVKVVAGVIVVIDGMRVEVTELTDASATWVAQLVRAARGSGA